MKARSLRFKDGQGGAAITVRLSLRSNRDKIDAIMGDGMVKISLAAASDETKANQAVIDFLAGTLEVPRSRIEVVAGEHSLDKLITILGLDAQAVQQRLLQHMGG